MKMPKNKKEIMVLACSILASMVVGIAVGCIKEKMANACTCIIDEL